MVGADGGAVPGSGESGPGEPAPAVDGEVLPEGVTLTLVPWDHPDAVALREVQETELCEVYGKPAPAGPSPEDTVLATVVVHVHGVAAGCGSLLDAGRRRPAHGEITRLYTSPEHRGQGLARHVLAALERIAVGHDLERLVLETGARQTEAIRLYRRAGYRRVGSSGAEVEDPESVRYARWLLPAAGTRVLLVSGSLGAGKTATAEAVGRALRAREVPHAFVDLDALAWVWPTPPEDPFAQGLALESLAAIAPGLRVRGYRHVVLARVVESAEERELYEEALDGADVVIVRVTADEETRVARLSARERDEPARSWHLSRTVELEEELTATALDDAVVDTTDLTPTQAAAQVLAAARW